MIREIGNTYKYNSFLVIFLLFLYGMANLFSAIIPAGYVIIVLAILVIVPHWLVNMMNTDSNAVCVLAVLWILLLIQSLIHPQNMVGIEPVMIEILSLGASSIYIGSLPFNASLALIYGRKLAWINFIINIIYVIFTYDNIDLLSMRFGYGMLPSTMIFLYLFLRTKHKLYLVMTFISLLSIIIWGSRGCLLVIFIYFICKYGRKYWLLLSVSGGVIWCFYDQFARIMIQLISTLPVESYKLRKLIMMLTQGIVESSSGRDRLYSYYWQVFQENIFGVGVGYSDRIGLIYPHNLFIQVAIEFGIIGLLVLLVLIVYIWRKIFCLKSDYYELLTILASMAFGRLFVSSSYWARPEFWVLISLIVVNRSVKANRNNYINGI